MNKCFFGGKIESEINFKFIISGKKYSAVKFKLKLFDNTVLNVVGYNYVADYIYRKLKLGDIIFCEAVLGNNEVIINRVKLV